MPVFTAKAIAYDAAHQRLAEVEVRHEDEEYAAVKALQAVKNTSQGAYWVTIELQIS